MDTENHVVTSKKPPPFTLRDVIARELYSGRVSTLLDRLEGQVGHYIREWTQCHAFIARTMENPTAAAAIERLEARLCLVLPIPDPKPTWDDEPTPPEAA